MRQLNFPEQLLDYLKDYYTHDNIITEAAGQASRRQFQSRGLRQGCNMSSILFVLYLIALGPRLEASGLGVDLGGGLIIAYLKFADDIFLISSTESGLEDLKIILEGWCFDFRMKVSKKKTQVISPDKSYVWTITDLEDEANLLELKHVDEYKYLGVVQKLSLRDTTVAKQSAMVSRATTYKNSILRLRNTLPDKLDVSRATWENIANPSILYGADVLPVDLATIAKLDEIQNYIAKVLLGVPKSSSNKGCQLEMGFKPYHLRVLHIKLKFYLNVHLKRNRCTVTQRCLALLWEAPSSDYLDNLRDLLMPLGIALEDVSDSTITALEDYHKSLFFRAINDLKSLKLLPLPSSFWKKSVHVEEGVWSRSLSRFRLMNAGLGNRDTVFKQDAVATISGEIKICPLCVVGKNDEIHLVIQCPELSGARSSIKLGRRQSLTDCLAAIHRRFGPETQQEHLRLFLGQEHDLSRTHLIQRGFALDRLVDHFFELWSLKLSRPVARRPGLDLTFMGPLCSNFNTFSLSYKIDVDFRSC